MYKDTHTLVAARRGASKLTIGFGHAERTDTELTSSYRKVYVQDGERTGEVELWINLDALLRSMGPDALRSKAKVAKRCGGLVQVRAVNVTEKKVQS